ncbi:MAG: M48 family metalloprotease [Actinobacteria bacterium]|nr:M48 family metalloprotease [Actinomycetota bacterium]
MTERPPPAREGDEIRLDRIVRHLERFPSDQTLPGLVLKDGHGSSARPARLGRSPCIWMSREVVDANDDAFNGELAHEYAHIVDPRAGRDWFAAFSGLTVLVLAAIGTYGISAMSQSGVGKFAAWAAGTAAVGAAACWFARFSHRGEFWADKRAAALLGDSGPVIAMLRRVEARHVLRGRRERLVSLLTHPHPSRRIRALQDDR